METSSFSGSVCSSLSEASLPWDAFNTGDVAWADFSPSDQERIVRHFSPKVKYLALRVKAKLPDSIELTDLISSGTLGLMESFTKFNPELGNKFETYAESRIKGAMLDDLRKLDWFPRSLRRRVKELESATNKFERLYNATPTEEQLAAETGLEIKKVREGLEAMQNQFCLSLDLLQESNSPESERKEGEPYSQVSFQEIISKLANIVEELTPREKLVLSLYYTDELNMREAAEVMGITEGRISQLHSQALARLRKEFSQKYGNLYES